MDEAASAKQLVTQWLMPPLCMSVRHVHALLLAEKTSVKHQDIVQDHMPEILAMIDMILSIEILPVETHAKLKAIRDFFDMQVVFVQDDEEILNQATQLLGVVTKHLDIVPDYDKSAEESLRGCDQLEALFATADALDASKLRAQLTEFLTLIEPHFKSLHALLHPMLALPDEAYGRTACDTVLAATVLYLRTFFESNIAYEPFLLQITEHMEQLSAPEAADDVASEGGDFDLSAQVDDEILEIFAEEVEEEHEMIASLCSQDKPIRVPEIKNSFHTLKGSGRLVGASVLSEVAAAAEDYLIAIQAEQEVPVHAIPVLAKANDIILNLSEAFQTKQKPDIDIKLIINEIASLADPDAAQVPTVPQAPGEKEAQIIDDLLIVYLEEARELTRTLNLNFELWCSEPTVFTHITQMQRELHTLKGGARMVKQASVADLVHVIEQVYQRVLSRDLGSGSETRQLLMQAHEMLNSMIVCLQHGRDVPDPSVLITALTSLETSEAEQVESSDESEDKQAAQVVSAAITDNVKISVTQLDQLNHLVGEDTAYWAHIFQNVNQITQYLYQFDHMMLQFKEQLHSLTIQADACVSSKDVTAVKQRHRGFDPLELDRYTELQRLAQSLGDTGNHIDNLKESMASITRQTDTLLSQQGRSQEFLKQGLLRAKMLPFSTVFPRLKRIVAQISKELGKQINFDIMPIEGELDRHVLERIIPPLEHMLRNAIDHGIEMPEVRAAEGKPEQGEIRLSGWRVGDELYIELQDDGAGLDVDKIRRKAISKGLMKETDKLSSQQIMRFVLESGFSTRDQVTQVSGHGLGMDIVYSEIKQIGGNIDIRSERGMGSSITIAIPLTQALTKAIITSVGDTQFALPVSAVVAVVRQPVSKAIAYRDPVNAYYEHGGVNYPVAYLSDVIGYDRPMKQVFQHNNSVPVILLRSPGCSLALMVDSVNNAQEVVVKSIGTYLKPIEILSGAAILGDGSIVFLLDVMGLSRRKDQNLQDRRKTQRAVPQPRMQAGVTVMVVDDSATVRKVSQRTLERAGYQVTTAKDGVDAIEVLAQTLPDVILLDIEMPRMDGFELTRHIREQAELKHIPIIMITSRSGDKHREHALSIGANEYFHKPFQEEHLLTVIKTYTRHKAQG